MEQFPSTSYSTSEIKAAGIVLAGDLTWTDETAPIIRHAFSVANSFRDSHAFPMRSIRHLILHFMRACDVTGLSAARLKRMKAIRAELARNPAPLHKLQDVAGCRFILPTIDDVHRLVG